MADAPTVDLDARAPTDLEAELAGLDALDTAPGPSREWGARAWSATWPKLLAVALAVGIWQVVVWLELKPAWVLPGPGAVAGQLRASLEDGSALGAVRITMGRAIPGFALALVIGTVIGIAVSRFGPLRVAVGSLLTGLQTMPSIAWFPLAILLFKISEAAILFVVVLGAAPAIANGLINGTDHVPPILVRAGHVLGARGFGLYRHVVLPASLPAYLGGLKQGWAFAWRSLLAGELIVIIEKQASLGVQLQTARELADAPALLATMVVILLIGVVVDAAFGVAERSVLRRRGLLVA